MPVATPELTIVVTVTKWDVRVTVNIQQAGETRKATLGEAEVQILDIGEIIADRTVYNETYWAKTNMLGEITFYYVSFPWLEGYDGVWGANRLSVVARLTDKPEIIVSKDIRIGTDTWSSNGVTHAPGELADPPEENLGAVVSIGVPVAAGLALIFFARKR